MVMTNGPFILRGAKEISGFVGVNWKNFSYFVREKQLPAWQYDGVGLWLALPEDLAGWVRKMRDENLKPEEQHDERDKNRESL